MHEPTFEAKTVQAAVQWTSPDGQRTIYEIVIERPDGKKHKLKTFSSAIGAVGWSGTVQAYEKRNKNGQVETYVKQPPKEDGKGWNKPQANNTTRADDNGKSFYYSYAKDIVVALIEAGHVTDFGDGIEMIVDGGERLYGAVNSQADVKQSTEPTQADIDSLTDVFPEISGEEHAETDYDPI